MQKSNRAIEMGCGSSEGSTTGRHAIEQLLWLMSQWENIGGSKNKFSSVYDYGSFRDKAIGSLDDISNTIDNLTQSIDGLSSCILNHSMDTSAEVSVNDVVYISLMTLSNQCSSSGKEHQFLHLYSKLLVSLQNRINISAAPQSPVTGGAKYPPDYAPKLSTTNTMICQIESALHMMDVERNPTMMNLCNVAFLTSLHPSQFGDEEIQSTEEYTTESGSTTNFYKKQRVQRPLKVQDIKTKIQQFMVEDGLLLYYRKLTRPTMSSNNSHISTGYSCGIGDSCVTEKTKTPQQRAFSRIHTILHAVSRLFYINEQSHRNERQLLELTDLVNAIRPFHPQLKSYLPPPEDFFLSYTKMIYTEFFTEAIKSALVEPNNSVISDQAQSISPHQFSAAPISFLRELLVRERLLSNKKSMQTIITEAMREILAVHNDCLSTIVCLDALMHSVEKLSSPLTAVEVISECLICNQPKAKIRTEACSFLCKRLEDISAMIADIEYGEIYPSKLNNKDTSSSILTSRQLNYQYSINEQQNSQCGNVDNFILGVPVGVYKASLLKARDLCWASLIDVTVLDSTDSVRLSSLSCLGLQWQRETADNLHFHDPDQQHRRTDYTLKGTMSMPSIVKEESGGVTFSNLYVKMLFMKCSDNNIKIRNKAVSFLCDIGPDTIDTAFGHNNADITLFLRRILLQVCYCNFRHS